MLNGKHAETVLQYVNDVISGKIVACVDAINGCKRFLRMVESGEYDVNTRDADFVIGIIEKTFKHRQGQAIDGTPLRGMPFLLEPWEKYIVYGILIFYKHGTRERVVKEGLIFISRKQGKTLIISALTWALALLERKSGSKVYVAAASLKQARETFDSWNYNISSVMYQNKREAAADGWRILNSTLEHSISNEDIGGGSITLSALANNPDKQDSFNANIVVLDEIHAYKSPAQYNRMKEATKAYTNKLCIAITTAGDDPQSFCAKRIEYCQSVLRGDVKDDAYFMFLCHAEQDENGNVDYTNPVEHMKANPNYGVTVRPEDMTNAALQAQNDPQQRKDFLTRSLNVFVSSMRAYFNIDEFKRSNETAGEKLGIDPKWTLDRKLAALVKLPVQWFGGADLSKLHDLTAACLHGCYNGIDIVIPHCWFPIVMAHEKAEQDGIPLFGWQEDGYLDMCNTPTVNHSAVVNWFIRMKKLGFKIKQVGHDRKFCREYFVGIKKAGFNVVDQPQYFFKKSEGFRHIETKAKNGELYYLGAEPYEYCVANVRAIEKTDDMVVFEKIRTERRIDVFDADVFATVRMLEDMTSRKVDAKKWLG